MAVKHHIFFCHLILLWKETNKASKVYILTFYSMVESHCPAVIHSCLLIPAWHSPQLATVPIYLFLAWQPSKKQHALWLGKNCSHADWLAGLCEQTARLVAVSWLLGEPKQNNLSLMDQTNSSGAWMRPLGNILCRPVERA